MLGRAKGIRTRGEKGTNRKLYTGKFAVVAVTAIGDSAGSGCAFPLLQKPEMGRDFSDKWILIKRVPAGIAMRAWSPCARCALTMNLIRSSPFRSRVRSSSFVTEISPSGGSIHLEIYLDRRNDESSARQGIGSRARARSCRPDFPIKWKSSFRADRTRRKRFIVHRECRRKEISQVFPRIFFLLIFCRSLGMHFKTMRRDELNSY